MTRELSEVGRTLRLLRRTGHLLVAFQATNSLKLNLENMLRDYNMPSIAENGKKSRKKANAKMLSLQINKLLHIMLSQSEVYMGLQSKVLSHRS